MVELFDVYNSKGEKTGEVKSKAEILASGDYRLVTHLWIYDPQTNKVLCQQRSEGQGKNMWDGYWDITVGGGVPTGEATLNSCVREAQEELGLVIKSGDLRLVGRFDTSKPLPELNVTAHEFSDTYVYPMDEFSIEVLVLQTEEVQAARWIEIGEVGASSQVLWVPHPESYYKDVRQFILRD